MLLEAKCARLNERFKLDVRLLLGVAMFGVVDPSTVRCARSWACVLLTIVDRDTATWEKR